MIRKILQLISNYPFVPARIEPTFYEEMEAWVTHGANITVGQQNQLRTEINNTVDDINAAVEDIATKTATATQASIVAQSAANYKGDWNSNYNNAQGYSLAHSVTFTDGFNYVSKINNNTTSPVSKTNTSQWNWIETIDPDDYTSAKLLTKIKEVDGAGSGLDADLLDGKQATDFMQVGFNLLDLNNMKTAGTYRVESGHLNMPSGVDYGNILVLRTPGANTYSQIITDWNSTNIYWRSGSDATGWQPWRRILSDGNALTTTPLGYASGLGVGGVVVQSLYKTDTVTLNKLTGRITMAATALANNQAVSFLVNNSFATNKDFIGVSAYGTGYNYKVETNWITDGQFQITVTNKSGASLSEALPINFTIIKGANS